MAALSESEAVDAKAAPPLWLLEFHGKSSADLLWDPRFLALVNLQLQRIRLPLENCSVAEVLTEFLSGNPGYVEIVEDRYLQLVACKRHFGKNKALLWIDCRSANATTGVVLRLYHRLGEEKVAIGVNTVGPEGQIPPQFLAHAIRWLRSGGDAVVEIGITDSRGCSRFLDPQILGFNVLRPRLQRKVKRRRHVK
jgi:hypothetical protein